MSDDLPEPFEQAIFYEDEKLYACLANYPKTKGHTVVVWKDEVSDLHLLSKANYKHLMECVDEIRNVLIETLGVEKVYLTYLDETEHVHWHLIPRYNQKGYDVLEHDPGKLEDFSLSDKLKQNLKLEI
jgi:diadenosine tetraphosphate (Ap4A) HIT family hydrolase